MGSSFLSSFCAAAITFFTLLGTTFFMFYKKVKSHQENNTIASSSSSLSLSSTPSSLSRNRKHDVFPSFHGADVRKTFLAHILKEFKGKGIVPFIDNDIDRSKFIGPELIEAIKGSKIAIVLLSRNYASSSWCLNELVEIMKCREELGQTVMTIFYDVDPTDVKKQTGDFGKVFKKTCKGKTKEDIKRWQNVLESVATIAGEHSRNWDNDAVMTEKIATDVSNMLNRYSPSRDFDGLIGMGGHMNEMESLLCLDSDEVRMIGIWGPSGIGKTTIARVLYSQFSESFELSIFMENIKELMYTRPVCSDEYSAKIQLQKQFLSQIINHKDMELPHLGVAQDRLNDKKVLIVLDSIDQSIQLDAIAKETRWFGHGSRIIITTQDQKLLKAHGINHIYKVEFPSAYEAYQMFCMYAFDQNFPKDGFEELAWQVTKLLGNLPLGLRVMGSHFRGMSRHEWVNALPRLKIRLDASIQSILKFSYDALCEEDKDLFLHIACLFNNEEMVEVEDYLALSFFDVRQRLHLLAEKSLIALEILSTNYTRIKMHNLLVQLGRDIVRHKPGHQCIREPGKRQFLVDDRDICEVLTDNTGSRNVIGILFELYNLSGELNISERAFEGLANLKFLRFHGPYDGEGKQLYLPQGLNNLPRKLRLIEWSCFPLICLPSNFCTEYLVELRMANSKLQNLWQGNQSGPFTSSPQVGTISSQLNLFKMAIVMYEEEPRDYPPRAYPPRLYAEGESILENKLINHNIKMGDFPGIRESIGQDAWNEMKGSPIGIIAKLADSQFVWSGKTVHFLLCRQLRIHKKEIWFLVGGQPIRFGLNEFGHITGLNTGSIPTEKFEPKADYKAFFSELNVPGGEGPKLDELRAGLLVCRTWTPEKRKWLGLLTLQAIGLYGLHHNSRIPFESAKRVFDEEAMNTYPWGRSAFEALVNSIKMLRPIGKTYTVSGMVYVLQAWAYDSVKCFGERFGRVVNKDEIPLLRWGGNRTRTTMELTIAEDIKAHGELRVSKLVMKDDVRELFHTWPDEEEDPALDNLILDIHEDKYVKGYWDVKKTEKKKKNVNSNAAGDSESPAKRQKVHNVKKKERNVSDLVGKREGGESYEGDVQKKKKKKEEKGGNAKDDVLEDVSVKTVLDLVKQLNSRFDTFDTSIKEVSSKMEKVIGDRVEARMDVKFGDMEKELKQMKERLNAIEQGVGKSDENAEGNSAFKETELPEKPTQVDPLLNRKEKATPKGPAKPPQNQSVTSPLAKDNVDVEKDIGLAGVSKNLEKEFANVIDGKSAIDFIDTFPINRNLRPRKKIDTAKIAAGKKKTGKDKPVKDKAPKDQPAVVRRRGRKPSSTTVKKVVLKKEGGAALDAKKEAADVPDKNEEVLENAGIEGDNEVYDVTEQLMAGNDRTLPESEDDEEEQIRIERIKALRKESVKLSPDGSALNPLSNVSERIFPHIGDNGLTCMRKNCVPSAGIYDPLSPVDPTKLQKLKEMMAPFKHLPLGRATDTVDFYKILITERKDWPAPKYGWLFDDHIAAYLRVLRKRFITRDPFPFHTKRIAFIDSWFVSYWCKEYDQFKIKPERFKFKGTPYEKLVLGLEPKDQQTNMKWIEDVDHLYIVHQIGGNHWVALDVDLIREHIDCYDSIVGQHTKESDFNVLEACRPFTRMIPQMMNEIIPPEIYSPRLEQFSFRRRNKSRVPQNDQVGDCGVYALKFIECLALGVSFAGICDENIQAIRVKMATEIYDEAPDMLAAFNGE